MQPLLQQAELPVQPHSIHQLEYGTQCGDPEIPSAPVVDPSRRSCRSFSGSEFQKDIPEVDPRRSADFPPARFHAWLRLDLQSGLLKEVLQCTDDMEAEIHQPFVLLHHLAEIHNQNPIG